MNLFFPICRDLFINFERFLFDWKLLQSTGSESGLIWIWIVLDPDKEENKQKKKMKQWLLEGIHPFPLGIVPQPTVSAGPLHSGALFYLHLLASFFLVPAGGRDPLLVAPGGNWPPRWGLCSLVQCPQEQGTSPAGGLCRVLHPCASAAL